MNDGLLGPRLTLGHGAPMLKRGLAAGAVAFRLFCHNDEKVSFSNDPPPSWGAGDPTYLKQNLFHPRMIRPVVGGGGRTYLKQKKKELSTKGH